MWEKMDKRVENLNKEIGSIKKYQVKFLGSEK
jgi:hypothetical protein